MNRRPVNSSAMVAVGYDPATEALEIEFHEGRVSFYSGVPESVHEGLISATSQGSYFAENIKGRYAYVQGR